MDDMHSGRPVRQPSKKDYGHATYDRASIVEHLFFGLMLAVAIIGAASGVAGALGWTTTAWLALLGLAAIPVAQFLAKEVAKWPLIGAPQIGSVDAAVAFVRPFFDNGNLPHERAICLGIGVNGRLVFRHAIEGERTQVNINVRDMLARALRADAIIILFFHNHPDGDVRPSRSDCRMTSRLDTVTRLIGMNTIDHIVITRDSHYSFYESGVPKDLRGAGDWPSIHRHL